MSDPTAPADPPAETPTPTGLDPVALAWYRYRIDAGHYDAQDVLRRLAEQLEVTSRVNDDKPPR